MLRAKSFILATRVLDKKIPGYRVASKKNAEFNTEGVQRRGGALDAACDACIIGRLAQEERKTHPCAAIGAVYKSTAIIVNGYTH